MRVGSVGPVRWGILGILSVPSNTSHQPDPISSKFELVYLSKHFSFYVECEIVGNICLKYKLANLEIVSPAVGICF